MRVVVGQQGRKLGVLVLTFGALVWLLGQVCCLKVSRVYILTKHKMISVKKFISILEKLI